MQVYRGEGIASHTSPKPCAVPREGHGEASVGKTCQPAIVPRKLEIIRNADEDVDSEGNMRWCEIASAMAVPRGLRTWRVWKSLVREPGEITTDQRCWPALGRRMRRSR